ncbi:MAG: serine/threonine-protein kinase [Myxococcota bacterium]
MDETAPFKRSLGDDDLVVLGVIGRGAFAEVRHAHRRSGSEPLALKVLRARDPEAERRLRKEGAILLGLDHPNILPIHEIREWEGQPALLTAFAPVGSLQDLLDRGGLPFGDALALFRGIVKGVAYAHAAGVLHRDLKPANILITHDAVGHLHPWVGDFGIARLLDGTTAATAFPIGTPKYMAQEQYTSPTDLDERVDIYALGCILRDLSGGSALPTFTTAIERCTRRRREDRPRTCDELLRLLDRAESPRRLVPMRFLVGLALVAVASLVGVALRPAPNPPCPLVTQVRLELAPGQLSRCSTSAEGEQIVAAPATCDDFKVTLLAAGAVHREQTLLDQDIRDLYAWGTDWISVQCGAEQVRVNRVPAPYSPPWPPSGHGDTP